MPRPILLGIVIFCVVAVIVGSLLPYDAKQAMGTKRYGEIQTPQGRVRVSAHRAYHFLMFGVTALVGMAMVRGRSARAGVALGVFALGVAIELAQHLYYGNEMEWWDIRDDGYGVLGAALMMWVWLYRRARAATSSST